MNTLACASVTPGSAWNLLNHKLLEKTVQQSDHTSLMGESRPSPNAPDTLTGILHPQIYGEIRPWNLRTKGYKVWSESLSRWGKEHSDLTLPDTLIVAYPSADMRSASVLTIPWLAVAAALPLEAALGAIKPDPKTVQIKGVCHSSQVVIKISISL